MSLHNTVVEAYTIIDAKKSKESESEAVKAYSEVQPSIISLILMCWWVIRHTRDEGRKYRNYNLERLDLGISSNYCEPLKIKSKASMFSSFYTVDIMQ